MRYAQQLPLPSYRHVPGQSPHPMSHPDGHRLMGLAFDEGPIDLTRWRNSTAYAYAVDLFNHGFYWEAHEVWEGLWGAVGRRGTTADFLKGLIKLAAALVKAREGRRQGVQRHARRAAELFAHLSVGPGDHADRPIGGLRLSDLRAMARELELLDTHSPLPVPLQEAELPSAQDRFQLRPR
jgi:predicted metal-dependent hydrolase